MNEPVKILNDGWNVQIANVTKIRVWFGISWGHVYRRAKLHTPALFIQVCEYMTFLKATCASTLAGQAKLTGHLPTSVAYSTTRELGDMNLINNNNGD